MGDNHETELGVGEGPVAKLWGLVGRDSLVAGPVVRTPFTTGPVRYQVGLA